jgi:IS605 OrfB family transposase
MYQVKLQKKFYNALITLLEDGQMKIKLILHDIVKKENDFITLINLLPVTVIALKMLMEKEIIVTVESLHKIKKMIYKDKSLLCEKNTLMLLLSKILILGLIGNVEVYSPCYSKSKITKWKELLSHTKIDYVDLLSNSSNTFAHYSKLKSWFLIQVKNQQIPNSQMTYFQLYKFSHIKKWEKEDITQMKVIRLMKIQLQPKKHQIKILYKFINDCRFIYNQGVQLFNEHKISNFFDLKKLLVSKKSKSDLSHLPKVQIPNAIYDTPSTIRSQELKVLSTNIKSAFANLKNKNITHFKLQFKSKKTAPIILNEEHHTSSIITKNNKKYLNISKLKNILIKDTKKLKNYTLTKDFKIQKTKLNKWYLLLPYELNTKNTISNICALDPGFKTFQTGIDLKGKIFKIGDNCLERIKKIETKSSINQSKLSLFKKVKKYKEYKNYVRIKYNFLYFKQKITNLINDLHYQTCNYLLKRYNKIILPIFESKKMISKKNKTLNGYINNLRHYQFQERLKNKCKENNATLILVDESYTSKECGNCGKLDLLLGSNRKYNCKHCKYSADRDENASYNILKNTINGISKIHKIIL